MNRLRMEHRASLSAAERELETLQGDIRRIIQAIKNGFAGPDLKAEWDALQERKAALQATLVAADKPPPLLHPEMARIYRAKVTELAKGRSAAGERTEPTDALRGLVDAILLTPGANGRQFGIEVRGNMAAMLGATVQRKRPSGSDDLSLQVTLVAGACNPLNLEFS